MNRKVCIVLDSGMTIASTVCDDIFAGLFTAYIAADSQSLLSRGCDTKSPIRHHQ